MSDVEKMIETLATEHGETYAQAVMAVAYLLEGLAHAGLHCNDLQKELASATSPLLVLASKYVGKEPSDIAAHGAELRLLMHKVVAEEAAVAEAPHATKH